MVGAYAGCAALSIFASFKKGFNRLWLFGAYAPLYSLAFYQYARQPDQLLENCYSYLVQKRRATVEYQQMRANFEAQDFTQTFEYTKLRDNLAGSGKTLYELENDIISKIDGGKF